ncbi:MAG TPA: ATP-binding protein [Dehalococcoidia bacterium]|nr:ATP-binding protein [Dehalococcoidia bacterium]
MKETIMLGTVEAPAAPASVEETRLDIGLLADLALKTLYFAGNAPGETLAAQMALPLQVTSEVLGLLRREQLCVVTGGAGISVGGLDYSLTTAGLERASSALSLNGYVGPAPVPLSEYFEAVQRQSIQSVEVTREEIEDSMSHLVLAQRTVDFIGQAVSAKKAMLIYGSSGNGKSTAAESLGQAFKGTILIPYAVEVMHQVIQIFDPSTHETVELPESTDRRMLDKRWVLIKRPLVFAAGELAASHLELVLDPVHKTYEAPIQMKANGGLLVIDDFGRQHLDAAYLLNRWIVPLEKGVDNLSLQNGARFQAPFDVVPIFVTNRQPADLADEAFLRRIRYKIEISPPTAENFTEIMKRECARNGIVYTDQAANYLLQEHFESVGRPLRGCHPRDILEAVAAAARYQGREPVLTPDAIDEACANYFA